MSFRRAVAPALALAVIVSLASLIGTPDGASAAEIRPHDSLVPDSPKGGYPIILKEPLRDVPNPDNNPNLPGATWRQVFAADQAGRFIVTGGDFYQIELQDGTVLQQKYFAAWNIDTKQIVCPNKFVFDNEVLAVEPGPSPTQVYVGGRFTKVTGSDGVQRTRNKVALLDLADCSVDRTFASTGANGKINEVVLSNGRLFVGGDFTSIGGVNQPVIAELNPVTGRTDTNWRVSFSGGLTSKIRGMSANPDGTRLIFGGRFGTVTDTRGKSIPGSVTAILDITSNPPRLTDHSYAYTHPEAPGRAYGHSLQDVSISPDGTNIGLAFGTTTISDYVYLVPAVERGTNHTWDFAPQDSSFSVGVSNNAVYVQGHFCKVPSQGGAAVMGPRFGATECTGTLFAGPSVWRTQIMALRLSDGQPLAWNPGTDAFTGGRELTITTRGLLAGFDGERSDDRKVGSLAFFDFGPGVEDLEPPQNVSFTSPANGAAVNNPAVITGRAQDNIGVASYQVAVQAADGRWIQANGSLANSRHVFYTPARNDGSFEIEVTMPAGNYTVEAKAVDAAGFISPNWTRRSFTQTGIEGIRPQGTITAPGERMVLGNRVTAKGSATDNAVVESIDVEITNSAGQWLQDNRSFGNARNSYPITITNGALGSRSASWSADLGSGLPLGSYKITARITDASNNTRTVTQDFAVLNLEFVPVLDSVSSLQSFDAGFDYTFGYTFSLAEDTQLGALSIFDTNNNGVLDNPQDTPVAIWQTANRNEVARATISRNATAEDRFFWAELDDLVELKAGVDYTIAARYYDGGERYVYQGNATVAAEANGFRVKTANYTTGTTLRFPDLTENAALNQISYGVPNMRFGFTNGNVNLTPNINAIADQAVTVGTQITPVQVVASDPEGDQLTYSVDTLPAGLNMNSSGRITGTPTTAGTMTSTVTVTDTAGNLTRSSFTWTVTGNNPPPPPPPPAGNGECVLTTNGNQITLTWDAVDGENDNYQIRRNGSWQANVAFNAGNTWTGNGNANDTWTIRSREGGINTDLACQDNGGGNPPPPPPPPAGNPACAIAVNGGQVTLTWDAVDGENDNYQIRRNGSWRANVAFNAGNTWTGNGNANDTWTIRSREGGINTDLACA